jgi:hypothetical protein
MAQGGSGWAQYSRRGRSLYTPAATGAHTTQVTPRVGQDGEDDGESFRRPVIRRPRTADVAGLHRGISGTIEPSFFGASTNSRNAESATHGVPSADDWTAMCDDWHWKVSTGKHKDQPEAEQALKLQPTEQSADGAANMPRPLQPDSSPIDKPFIPPLLHISPATATGEEGVGVSIIDVDGQEMDPIGGWGKYLTFYLTFSWPANLTLTCRMWIAPTSQFVNPYVDFVSNGAGTATLERSEGSANSGVERSVPAPSLILGTPTTCAWPT